MHTRKFVFAALLATGTLFSEAGIASDTNLIEVRRDQLHAYWTPNATTATRTLERGPLKTARERPMADSVELEYTIDKRGRVRDVVVVSKTPERADATWAETGTRAFRYRAGPENPDMHPVRVVGAVMHNVSAD
jgi:hypothetical protein